MDEFRKKVADSLAKAKKRWYALPKIAKIGVVVAAVAVVVAVVG